MVGIIPIQLVVGVLAAVVVVGIVVVVVRRFVGRGPGDGRPPGSDETG